MKIDLTIPCIVIAAIIVLGIPIWIFTQNEACEKAGGTPMVSSRYFTNRANVKCYDTASLKEIKL